MKIFSKMGGINTFIDKALRNGGASINLITGDDNPTTGYMISMKGRSARLPSDVSHGQLKYYLADYIKINAYALLAGIVADDAYLGAWLDTETNEIVIDVSKRLNCSIDEAIETAIKNQQTHIYACAAGINLATGYNTDNPY